MDSRFREYDPNQPLLLPPDLRDWVPASHLAAFLLDVVSDLDLSQIYATIGNQAKGGRPAYHPLLMVRLLLYGYCTGTYSSRKLERKTYEDLAVRFLTADQHPDHDTIAAFRQKHLSHLEGLFLQVLVLCKEAGLVKLGHVAVDGTKVKANASKHKAMSYERMTKEEKRLEEEIAELKATVARLLQTAQQVDADEDDKYGKGSRGDELPEELARRESRLRVIREAKARVEARAQAAQAQLAKKDQANDEGEDDSESEPPAGCGDTPSDEVVPDPKAQSNFTDPESRIMIDGATKAYVQAYNGQLAVDSENQIIVAAELTQAAPDSNQLVPALEAVKSNCGELPHKVTADAGYCSEENLHHPMVRSVDAYIATSRERKSGLATAGTLVTLAVLTIGELMFGRFRPRRFSVFAKKLYKQSFASTLFLASLTSPGLTPLRVPTEREKMRHKVQTPEGKAVYARRKAIVEPVNGQIKEARGFRRFSMRGYAKCQAEWRIVATAHNLLKLFKALMVSPAPA
jgi:transposase